MKLTTGQIDAAVEFWAEKLKSPDFDNGTSGLASSLATMFHKSATDTQVEKFKESLQAYLIGVEHNYIFHLGVDYHPDQILGDALTFAGLDGDGLTTLPWKTSLIFRRDGTVEARSGYGGLVEIIYSPEIVK